MSEIDNRHVCQHHAQRRAHNDTEEFEKSRSKRDDDDLSLRWPRNARVSNSPIIAQLPDGNFRDTKLDIADMKSQVKSAEAFWLRRDNTNESIEFVKE